LVLIDLVRHHEVMFGLILIALIVALVPLAYFAGADSRVDEVARRRRYSG
jgi:RsiW-degrading membrane proteinase PrsW (M82 family)